MSDIRDHARICDELRELYVQKNGDYGDSFHKSWEDYGITVAAIRIGDKYNRLRNITAGNAVPGVSGETVQDTLLDLANYAIMSVMEMEAQEYGDFVPWD